jgi:hypothetical protein
MIRLEELQAEVTGLVAEASQHKRDATAFDEQEPDFAHLDAMVV